jgi:hypothetical protein
VTGTRGITLTQVGVAPQNRRYIRNRAGTTVVNLALQATAKGGYRPLAERQERAE